MNNSSLYIKFDLKLISFTKFWSRINILYSKHLHYIIFVVSYNYNFTLNLEVRFRSTVFNMNVKPLC